MMRFDWTVEVDGDDISQWVKAAGTIDYGKPTRFTGFQAPSAIFEIFTKDENPNPAPAPGTWPDINLGDPVIIHVTWDGVNQIRRFSGIVQALDYGLYGLRVTATGAQVDGDDAPMGRPYFGAADWQLRIAGGTGPVTNYPAAAPQLEDERVQWLCETAGLPVEIEGVPARKVRAIPTNTPGQPLLDAVLRVADDCDGLLLQDRLGVMRYRTKNFTHPNRYTLPAHVVESTTIDMALERGTLANQVTVYYGEPDPATGNQKTTSAQDDDSIIEYGERRADIYTDIQSLPGAQGRAEDYLLRSRAQWEMPDVTLVMNQATGAEADAILELQEGWRVKVTPLPDGCPIAEYDADILGFTEVMHETDYRMILHLAPTFDPFPEPYDPPTYPDGVLTGYESTGTWTEAVTDRVYRWVQFTTPGAHTLGNTHDEPVECRLVAVAGGGGSGSYAFFARAGGGGGGGTLVNDWVAPLGSTAVTVGAGGTAAPAPGGYPNEVGNDGGDGQPTIVGDITLPGGGGGGGGGRDGRPGGSGGGAGQTGGAAKAGGAGVPGYGYFGADTFSGNGNRSGGGGGASTPGTPGVGGLGASTSITGTLIEYGAGGDGDGWAAGVNPGQGGSGGYNGSDPRPGTAGAPGVVVLAYRIG